MKRKLSLLLAIVMILSLVPMSAFAGTVGVADAVNRFASTATIDETKLTADGEDAAKIQVYSYDEDYDVVTDAVYVATNRGDVFYTNDDLSTLATGVASGTKTAYTATNTAGKTTFYFGSKIAGDVKVYVGTNAAVAEYAQNVNNVTASDAGLIKEFAITLESDTTAKLDTGYLVVKESKDSTTLTAVDADSDSDLLDGEAYSYSKVTANGIDYYELEYKVVNKTTNAPVPGLKIEMSANKAGARFNKTELTTDAVGKAKVKVYADKSATYTITATMGDEEANTKLTFNAGTTFDIKITSGADKLRKLETDHTIKFKLYDFQGNLVKTGFTSDTDVTSTMGNYKIQEITVQDSPDGMKLDDSDLVLKANDDTFKIIAPGAKLNKEGDVTIRIILENGKYVDVKFTVKKQGTITKMTLEYDQVGIAYNGSTTAPTVTLSDDAGVEADETAANVANKVTFSVSDAELVSAIATTSPNAGKITASGDDKYTGKLVVTAFHTDKKLSATYELMVTGKPFALKAEPKTAKVGETAAVDFYVVDKNGNKVSVVASEQPTAYVVSKPAGANASADVDVDAKTDLEESGVALLEVDSNKAGTVKVNVIVKVSGISYSTIVDVAFGTEPVVVPVKGVKSLVLNIASTVAVADGAVKTMDVAPFIKDGRTFVPVRFIAEQLGAEVSFTQNAAGLTETVTLTRDDLVVTMTMGSKDIKVVKAGVTTTVAADVAAYVESGRTVLPFRALAEAMGAEVAYGMTADNAAVAWVSFTQK